MEIILFILGIIIGGLISWLISHVYYAKSNKDQHKLFSKLTQEVRSLIINDKRESFTILELNELLIKKSIKDFPKGDPLPYKACPKCGSEKLKRGEYTSNDDNYYVIQCQNCAWQDWTQ